MLLSTLGGIIAFGAAGIIIGPIVAALWVTVWEIYGETFADYLPRVEMPVTETVAHMSVVVPPGADSSPIGRHVEPSLAPFEGEADVESEGPPEGSSGGGT